MTPAEFQITGDLSDAAIDTLASLLIDMIEHENDNAAVCGRGEVECQSFQHGANENGQQYSNGGDTVSKRTRQD